MCGIPPSSMSNCQPKTWTPPCSWSTTSTPGNPKRERAGGSKWELTVWIRSSLRPELLLADSLWPACIDGLWQHLTFRDLVGNYRLRFRSPNGTETVLPFSSLSGLVNLLRGSMRYENRKGLLSTGTFAWILQLDKDHFSAYSCDLRFYDRYVDHAEDFVWRNIDRSEQEKEATRILQAPRSTLIEGLWPAGAGVLELLKSSLHEESFMRSMSTEDDGMWDFFKEMGQSLHHQLQELYPQERQKFDG